MAKEINCCLLDLLSLRPRPRITADLQEYLRDIQRWVRECPEEAWFDASHNLAVALMGCTLVSPKCRRWLDTGEESLREDVAYYAGTRASIAAFEASKAKDGVSQEIASDECTAFTSVYIATSDRFKLIEHLQALDLLPR